MNTFALSSALTATTMLLCRVKHVEGKKQVNFALKYLEEIQERLDTMIRDHLHGSEKKRGVGKKPKSWDRLVTRLESTAIKIPGSYWPVIEMRETMVNAGSVVIDEILPALRSIHGEEPAPLIKLRDAVQEVDQTLTELLNKDVDDSDQELLMALQIVDIDGLLDDVEQMGILSERPELHRELMLTYGDFRDFDELGRRMKASMFFGAAA